MHRNFVALLFALLALHASAETASGPPYIVATGPAGGVYYPLGREIAKLAHDKLGWNARAEVTPGAVQNLNLLDKGLASVAFSSSQFVDDATKGRDRFKGYSLGLRTVAVMYPNRIHVVVPANSPFKSIADLKGRRVSTGAPNGGTEQTAIRLLDAYGLDANRDITRERLAVLESGAALKAGRIDAFFWSGGVPSPAITQLSQSMKIRFLPHKDGVNALMRKFGAVVQHGQLPVGSYAGVDKEIDVLELWNLLVVSETAGEQEVYELTKLIFENKAELLKAHPEASDIDMEKQGGSISPVPYHPGALRYFRERNANAAPGKSSRRVAAKEG